MCGGSRGGSHRGAAWPGPDEGGSERRAGATDAQRAGVRSRGACRAAGRFAAIVALWCALVLQPSAHVHARAVQERAHGGGARGGGDGVRPERLMDEPHPRDRSRRGTPIGVVANEALHPLVARHFGEGSGEAEEGEGMDTVEAGEGDGGLVSSMLSALRPWVPEWLATKEWEEGEDARRSHFFGQGRLHPFYLAPFQGDLKGLLDAQKALTSEWLGYGRDDPTSEASINYQTAVLDLTNNPRGGVPVPGNTPPFGWNGPTTGGVTIEVYGMGFGWDPTLCSEECLAGAGACTPEECLFVDGSVGDTLSSSVQWTSDSSVSLKLPPGLGTSLSVNVTSGRFKQIGVLDRIFTYDAPKEIAIFPSNAPPSGRGALTIVGKNFGHAPNFARDIAVGETGCLDVTWQSDSQVVCLGVRRGTGAYRDVRVNIGGNFDTIIQSGRTNDVPLGLSGAFSYDQPSITAINPSNGPPVGYSTDVTIYGKNFGWGPEIQGLTCPEDTDTAKYLLTPRVVQFCQTGFVASDLGPFYISQRNPVGGAQMDVFWDNIRPYSLAYDPVGCVFNAYQCDILGIQESCAFIPESCKPISSKSVPVLPADEIPTVIDTCPILNAAGDGTVCAPHLVGGYVPDGVTCEYLDLAADPNAPPPYFEFNNLAANAFFCSTSPKLESSCTSSCLGVGCCNAPGTTGARVAGTECVTLTWQSDSSLVCKVAPGLGGGLGIMVAIDDWQGKQVAIADEVFTFDSPRVTSISGGVQPTSGGSTITMLGQHFGSFQCNRTWCSFDDTLLLCDSNGCNALGQPKRSSSISQSASLLSTYEDGRPIGRSACAETTWTSDTGMTCKIQAGTGDLRTVELTVFRSRNQYSTALLADQAARSVAYGTPLPIEVTPNSPDSVLGVDGTVVTVFGERFGTYDTTPKARLAGTACARTNWVSDSVILCKVPRGLQSPDCQGIPGATTTEGCLAEVCSTCPNGLSGTVCPTPYDTHPRITGQGYCHGLVVTVDRQRGDITHAFSYDALNITSLKPNNGPLRGSYNITILGKNFGDSVEYGYSATVGPTRCREMLWTSDTSVGCAMSRGMANEHQVLLQVDWNSKSTTADNRFSYDRPVLRQANPSEIPTTGRLTVTIFGENFGAFDEFTNRNRIGDPVPPRSSVGDTVCAATQWTSDSSLSCAINGPEIGNGPGIGARLPLITEVGGQTGTMQRPFGFSAPQIFTASARNSPAVGGRSVLLYGDNFGVYDYSPTVSVGGTDCTVTVWQSNTAIRCVTPPATTFLAGQNIELPFEVSLGVSHRLGSEQRGILENFFFFDFPISVNFQLNNLEINVLCFVGAFLLAGLIICCLHLKYHGKWQSQMPALPVIYSRTHLNQQYTLKPVSVVPIPGHNESSDDEDREESSSSSASSSEDEYMERFRRERRKIRAENKAKTELQHQMRMHALQRKRGKGPTGPEDVQIHVEDDSDSDSEAGMDMRGALLPAAARDSEEDDEGAMKKPPKIRYAKDVATGKAVPIEDDDLRDTGKFGMMTADLESVPTPIPRGHRHASHQGMGAKKNKKKPGS